MTVFQKLLVLHVSLSWVCLRKQQHFPHEFLKVLQEDWTLKELLAILLDKSEDFFFTVGPF